MAAAAEVVETLAGNAVVKGHDVVVGAHESPNAMHGAEVLK